MTRWRPVASIKVKVLGVATRRDEFLVSNVQRDDGRITGVRPLGGSVEFGETRVSALHRELMEELGTAIMITSPWSVLDNIFEHEGVTGHELISVARIQLMNSDYYEQDTFSFREHDGSACQARWMTLEAIHAEGIALYPDGLEAVLGDKLLI